MTTVHVPPERMAERPGVGFGYGGSVLATAQSPQVAGTFQWGGVYGHNWFSTARTASPPC